jgi:hypothetical protein
VKREDAGGTLGALAAHVVVATHAAAAATFLAAAGAAAFIASHAAAAFLAAFLAALLAAFLAALAAFLFPLGHFVYLLSTVSTANLSGAQG